MTGWSVMRNSMLFERTKMTLVADALWRPIWRVNRKTTFRLDKAQWAVPDFLERGLAVPIALVPQVLGRGPTPVGSSRCLHCRPSSAR